MMHGLPWLPISMMSVVAVRIVIFSVLWEKNFVRNGHGAMIAVFLILTIQDFVLFMRSRKKGWGLIKEKESSTVFVILS